MPFYGSVFQCFGCEEWYHPKCSDCTETEIREMEADSFKCWWCDPYVMFLNKCTKQTDGLCPALESVTGEENDSEFDQENDVDIQNITE